MLDSVLGQSEGFSFNSLNVHFRIWHSSQQFKSMQPVQRKFQKELASVSTSNKTDIILTSQFNV